MSFSSVSIVDFEHLSENTNAGVFLLKKPVVFN